MKETFDYSNFVPGQGTDPKENDYTKEYTNVYVFDIEQFNLDISDIVENVVKSPGN